MSLHLIMDRQHIGKTSTSTDLGAGVDLNQDGRISSDEREANLTPLFIDPACEFIRNAGHTSDVLDSGQYSYRHRLAIQYAQEHRDQSVPYLAAHLNAGQGDYGAILYDQRSSSGKMLADCLAARLSNLNLSGVRRVITRGTSSESWARAHTTIKWIYSGPSNISGVCVEPLFMDTPAHQPHLSDDGLRKIGEALAAGCLDWHTWRIG